MVPIRSMWTTMISPTTYRSVGQEQEAVQDELAANMNVGTNTPKKPGRPFGSKNRPMTERLWQTQRPDRVTRTAKKQPVGKKIVWRAAGSHVLDPVPNRIIERNQQLKKPKGQRGTVKGWLLCSGCRGRIPEGPELKNILNAKQTRFHFEKCKRRDLIKVYDGVAR